jgi:hypothetical protein
MIGNTFKSFVVSVLLLLLLASAGRAEQVVLPLTLDYKLLTSLIKREAFPGKNATAAIVGRPGDCTYLGISEPKFSAAGKFVRLEMRLAVRVGTELGRECLVPVEWQGYLTLLQQPVFDGRTFSLSFRTVDSNLSTLSRQPAAITEFLWEFAKPLVYQHLQRVRFDLAPPVQEVRDFLAPLFHEQARQATLAMLDSLRGGDLAVDGDGVRVELHAEVEEVYVPKEGEQVEALSPAERQQLISLWETWDVLLVRLITLLAGPSLSPEDQQLLADVLLDTRYVFVEALEDNDLTKDFVRMQFVRAWRQLAPVFRRQIYAQSSENSLGYLAFFTAADALLALDRMGPTLGIEISQQGLLRLAAMLTGKEIELPYDLKVDEVLRKLLQLPPLEVSPMPGDEMLEIDLPSKENNGEPLTRLSDFFFTPAYGAEPPPFAEILDWRVPEEDILGYVERVRAVLAEASATVLTRQQFPEQLHSMYRTMIVAMAWQESCFRQFIEKNQKLTFLLSYNQTSVGVMQINERVWRGMYDRNRLRWDIRYNALAGCEIADLYLRRYALQGKAKAHRADTGLLAGLVYAMYNGGPGQHDKYLVRHKSGKTFPSDKLFAEKLQLVEARDWEQVKECLGGD